ncbi:uncharacterized protein LOC123699866 [Colias croceus]|uniref:uncharacterized protein LOC123699866 n=1 Tax=Colias crocea TaxID=72248 RepID=UPI001E280BFB|nr:uncharacterized protein LOC123699866 [Colias croceus]
MILFHLLWVSLFVSVKSAKIIKDAIGFPEVEENIILVNKQDRLPVFLPSTCRENELYYPGDQKDDWICDCRPGYLYHPDSDACWPSFRRGPCKEDEHLILLALTSVIPVCNKNPCEDGLVLWNGKCEALGAMEPCRNVFPLSTLWINATTVTVDCVPINIDNRFVSDIGDTCLPGCKRSIKKKCMPLIT